MKREDELQKFVDKISRGIFGKAQSDCIKEKICVMCHQPADKFKDELSKKEYGISGICQDCQDKLFTT